jgi:Rrf2 family protein
MLSQKARYALHALIVLAEHGGREPMMIADIAEEAGVPRKFLEQILLGLKKRGIVQSMRGRAGGYRLGRPAKEISFADIIRETDGPLALSPASASPPITAVPIAWTRRPARSARSSSPPATRPPRSWKRARSRKR